MAVLDRITGWTWTIQHIHSHILSSFISIKTHSVNTIAFIDGNDIKLHYLLQSVTLSKDAVLSYINSN